MVLAAHRLSHPAPHIQQRQHQSLDVAGSPRAQNPNSWPHRRHSYRSSPPSHRPRLLKEAQHLPHFSVHPSNRPPYPLQRNSDDPYPPALSKIASHIPALSSPISLTSSNRGEDGVWRKVEYELYGVCPNCSPVLDGQISRNVTMPNTNITKHDPPDNLPPGWQPMDRHPSGHTTLILAMSLVLAFFICFFIIGCLFWRKSMRRKYKEKDLEKRTRGRRRRRVEAADESLRAEEAREIQVERENKAKQKLWARATARWRANARHSARLRRGKRVSSSLRGRQSTASFDDDDSRYYTTTTSDESTPSHTPSHSRSPSRSSTPSFHQKSEGSNSAPSSPIDSAPTIPTIELSAPDPSASPPAYQQKSDSSQQGSSSGLHTHSCSASTSSPWQSRRPSGSSLVPPSPNGDDAGESQSPALTTAHVATDDKAVLARLAELASAPPSTSDESAPEPQVSVPEWRDEELEDFVSDDQDSRAVTSPTSPFPPPPPKAQLMEPNFYDYPYSFEEMTSMEPEYGPSAPPFEATSSAPMVDENMLLPSAPPLIDDDDFYVSDSIPSAPPAEDMPALSIVGEGQEDEQPSPQASTSRDSESSSNDSSATESILQVSAEDPSRGVLPVYRP
ncbi:hypothetical protein CC2G_000547 [Coprinopsis cinerea AmutBmut pab1-1]|nr:hypothetical protein CC2G_000547 [Coprinopsis cinerea AmutBmut pab1-1]